MKTTKHLKNMMKNLLLPGVLLGALLLATPAMGQTWDIAPDPDNVALGAVSASNGGSGTDNSGTTESGVWIDSTGGGTAWYAGWFESGTGWTNATSTPDTERNYNITGFTINFSDGAAKTVGVAAIASSDNAGNYTIDGDVVIIGGVNATGTLSGFAVGNITNMTGNIVTDNIYVENVSENLGVFTKGTGNTVGLEIGTGAGGASLNRFMGELTTGIITVHGGTGSDSGNVTSGITIWGSVLGSGTITTGVGDIVVTAAHGHNEANAYGMVVRGENATNNFSRFALGNTINVTNIGSGGAMGLSVAGTAKDEVTFTGAIIVENDDTGNATGIQMTSGEAILILTGSITATVSHEDAVAGGISMTGDGALVTLTPDASIETRFNDDGDVKAAGFAVGFDGDNSGLVLGDTFNNAGKVFNTQGMEHVTFAGAANLAEGQFAGDKLEYITVEREHVMLGEDFTISTTQESLTFDVKQDGSTFTTEGSVIIVNNTSQQINIEGAGTTNLLGFTVFANHMSGDDYVGTGVNAVITVEAGSTLGFDLAKTNLNIIDDVMGTVDGVEVKIGEERSTSNVDSLAFNLGTGSTLNIFGDASGDTGYLEAWKDMAIDDQEDFNGRRYATVTDPESVDYDFNGLYGGTEWKIEYHEGLQAFIIVPYATGDMFMSDGFLVALGMHNRYAAWHAVRDRMISSTGFNRNGFRGQSPCDAACGPCDAACDPCEPACGTVRRNGSRNAWVNYTGRSDALRGSNGFFSNDWRISVEGVQAGADLFLSRNAQFGVLFGYEGGRALNVGNVLKMDDVYVGAYGARVFRNGFDARGVVAFGWQDFDYDRDDNGTLATASFKGNTTEVNLELGRRFALYGSNWSFRPVMGLDVFNNNIKSATDNLDYKYDKTSLTQTFLRFGSDLRYQTRNFTFNSGFYYSYDMNDDVLRTNVSGAGVGVLSGAKLGRNLLTFNLGTDYQVTSNFSVFGGYQGEYATDRDNSQVHSAGYVGAGFKW